MANSILNAMKKKRLSITAEELALCRNALASVMKTGSGLMEAAPLTNGRPKSAPGEASLKR